MSQQFSTLDPKPETVSSVNWRSLKPGLIKRDMQSVLEPLTPVDQRITGSRDCESCLGGKKPFVPEMMLRYENLERFTIAAAGQRPGTYVAPALIGLNVDVGERRLGEIPVGVCFGASVLLS